MYQCRSCRNTFTTWTGTCPHCHLHLFLEGEGPRLPTYEEQERQRKANEAFGSFMWVVGCLAALGLMGYYGVYGSYRRGGELLAAVRGGDAAASERILRYPTFVNFQRRKGDATPLMVASAAGRADLVQLLLKKKANVEMTDGDARTSLQLAAANGRLDIVRLLLANKAKVDHRDREGKTALILASTGGHGSVVRALMAAGAKTSIRDNTGRSSALIAAGAPAAGRGSSPIELAMQRQVKAGRLRNKRMWLAPEIPPEKVEKTVKWAKPPAAERLLIVLELGESFSGELLLTDVAIYRHGGSWSPDRVALREIKSVAVRRKLLGDTLLVNGEVIFGCMTRTQCEGLDSLAEMLREVSK